jgi:hypothetical protein
MAEGAIRGYQSKTSGSKSKRMATERKWTETPQWRVKFWIIQHYGVMWFPDIIRSAMTIGTFVYWYTRYAVNGNGIMLEVNTAAVFNAVYKSRIQRQAGTFVTIGRIPLLRIHYCTGIAAMAGVAHDRVLDRIENMAIKTGGSGSSGLGTHQTGSMADSALEDMFIYQDTVCDRPGSGDALETDNIVTVVRYPCFFMGRGGNRGIRVSGTAASGQSQY